jgi:transmembrane sensor
MTKLRMPVKSALRTTTTRASVARMWNRIEARERARSRASARRAWPLAAAASALVVSTAFAIGWQATPRRHGMEETAPRAEPSSRPRVAVESPPVAPAPDAAPETAPVVATAPAPPARLGSPARAEPPRSLANGEAWRELAARGANEQAYAALGQGGVAAQSQSAPVEDLFALADVARLSGHPREAVEPLQRIVGEHSSDPRAPLAALTLGRIQLHSLQEPAAAAQSVQRALALGVPAGLVEDAYALLVESLSRAGDSAGARAAYAQFVERVPGSDRAAELRRWVREL